MHVIGTAGHVDHGKSTLVKALTGINPDRLAEEQRREMTIDLGFAWMVLPDGEQVGIIDVPGHIDFIENMLVGIGGIDLVLFVVAADEGIMPQTREHLAILDLLEIRQGIIVLTKIDAVDDPDWLQLISEDIRKTVSETCLSNAPILPVSAKNAIGLDALKSELSKMLQQCPKRPDHHRARLPIDRVFSMTGFGTIVTGTLLDGAIQSGQELIVLPEGLHARIRGLQNHKEKVEIAYPGSRVAVNLSNINTQQIKRGDVLAAPTFYKSTKRLTAHIRLLKDVSTPIKHDDSVKIFVGTQEVVARIRLLGLNEIKPGGFGWIQMEAEDPIVTYAGDKFILRRPSPGETIGGGKIIEIDMVKRYKRFDQKIVQHLEALLLGDPQEIVLNICKLERYITLMDLQKKAGLEPNTFSETLAQLLAGHAVIELSQAAEGNGSYILAADEFDAIKQETIHYLEAFHKGNPGRKGLVINDLIKSIKVTRDFINPMILTLKQAGEVVSDGVLVWLPSHQVTINDKMERQIINLKKILIGSPFSPPPRSELENALGKTTIDTLVELEILIPLTSDIVFLSTTYQEVLEQMRKFICEHGSISVAQLRDLVGTSRKYAVAFLEYFDKQNITTRQGDARTMAGE